MEINIQNVSMTYPNGKQALRDFNLRLNSPSLIGLLGPNGAGKSTLMKLLVAALLPTSGSILVDGQPLLKTERQLKAQLGYLPQDFGLFNELTVAQFLDYMAALKGLRDSGTAVREVIRTVNLEGQARARIRSLSGGQRQRVGIAQALLGSPEVIVLDEPTVGLDPLQIIEIRTLIKELGRTHTVLFSSHILSEVQNLCDQILIIAKGKLVAFDTPENLETRLRGQSEIRLTTDASREEAEKILSGLADIGQAAYAPGEGGLLCVRIQTVAQDVYAASRRLFFAFAQEKKALCELVVKRASLEDVFLELTESAGEPPAEETGPQSAQPEEKEEAKNP
mgnify:FL=1